MNLKPLADYLNPLLNPTPVFVYAMPETVKTAVLLLPDLSKGARWDHDLPGYRKANFLVVVRSINFQAGFALGKQAEEWLVKTINTQVGAFFIKQIFPLRDPLPFPKSTGDFIEFSAEMTVFYIDS